MWKISFFFLKINGPSVSKIKILTFSHLPLKVLKLVDSQVSDRCHLVPTCSVKIATLLPKLTMVVCCGFHYKHALEPIAYVHWDVH